MATDYIDTVEDLEAEIWRMLSPKNARAIMYRRWENVLTMWENGATLEAIGHQIDRAPSTVNRLIKRAALERQKQPGCKWPIDDSGYKICDIAHPMPSGEDPRNWRHTRLRTRTNTKTKKLIYRPVRDDVGYCPVCRKGGLLKRPVQGKPLYKVLTSS